MKWFYMESGQEKGPYDKDRMQDMVRQGVIKADTYVRNDSKLNWTTYGQLVEKSSGRQARSTPQGMPKESAGPAMQTGGPSVLCSQCGDSYAESRLVLYKGKRVCSSCSSALLQSHESGTAGVEYAGFWIRFGAKLIDGVILVIPLMAINLAFTMLIPGTDISGDFRGEFTPQAVSGFALMYLLQVLIPLAYTTFFLGRYAATPGKMALGLKVIMPGGGRVSYLRALGRHFAEFLSQITLYIGYIMAGFDAEKRALHDHIAGTRVIRKQTSIKQY